MRTLALTICLCCLAASVARAQDDLTPAEVRLALLQVAPGIDRPPVRHAADLTPAPPPALRTGFANGFEAGFAGGMPGGQPSAEGLALRAPEDSLPAGMPLHTRLLWGRRGVLRAAGIGPSTRNGELRLRRSMLQWHQRAGLLTFGAFTTQVVLGELLLRNPAKYHESLHPWHRGLGYATFGAYVTTASLSLGAPPARRYGGGFSSVKLHRYLALLHFTGMMAQPWLGRALSDARTADDRNRLENAHKWVGRVTYAAYSAAILSIFLPY